MWVGSSKVIINDLFLKLCPYTYDSGSAGPTGTTCTGKYIKIGDPFQMGALKVILSFLFVIF